jgi:hypothetical protein
VNENMGKNNWLPASINHEQEESFVMVVKLEQ